MPLDRDYEKLIDQIAEHLMERITGDDDDLELMLEEFALGQEIIDPTVESEHDTNENISKLIQFEGQAMLDAWERLALILLRERDNARRRRLEMDEHIAAEDAARNEEG